MQQYFTALQLALPWCRETVHFKIVDNFFASFYWFSYYLAINQKPEVSLIGGEVKQKVTLLQIPDVISCEV